MTDQDKNAAAMMLATESIRLAKSMEALLPNVLPVKHWDETQKAYRNSSEAKEDPFLFCWMKLAGATATVVPMCSLMAIGSYFAASILARSILEAVLSITFMFPDPSNSLPWPSTKQKRALDQFYTEIWDDILKPYETAKQTSQIPYDELFSSWGRLVGQQPGLNTHDMIQTVRQCMSCYSNYTHMGYPALMELFRGTPLRLSGKESTHAHFTLNEAAIILDNVCHAASNILSIYSKGLKNIPEQNAIRIAELCEQHQGTVDAISQRLINGFGLTCDTQKLLRAMKTGKPIDELLNPIPSER